MNTTEMERTQAMTEAWKRTARQVIDMLVEIRHPDQLKQGASLIPVVL